MAPRPAAEQCPEGLDIERVHVFDHALKTLKAQGTWAWELAPLLAEYVQALQAADWSRRNDEPTQWDRHAKRASALADQLALTPRGRKAVGVGYSDEDQSPFAEFADELAPRRDRKAS